MSLFSKSVKKNQDVPKAIQLFSNLARPIKIRVAFQKWNKKKTKTTSSYVTELRQINKEILHVLELVDMLLLEKYMEALPI